MMDDEAYFHLDGYINMQNCQIWAAEYPHELSLEYGAAIQNWESLTSLFCIRNDYSYSSSDYGHYINMLHIFLKSTTSKLMGQHE